MSDAPAPGRTRVAMSACDCVACEARTARSMVLQRPGLQARLWMSGNSRYEQAGEFGTCVWVSALVAAMCPRLQNRRPP